MAALYDVGKAYLCSPRGCGGGSVARGGVSVARGGVSVAHGGAEAAIRPGNENGRNLINVVDAGRMASARGMLNGVRCRENGHGQWYRFQTYVEISFCCRGL